MDNLLSWYPFTR